jgi:hypothetical protein
MTMITGTREIGRRVAIPASAVGSSTDMGLPIYTCFDLAKNKKEPETEINLYNLMQQSLHIFDLLCKDGIQHL